MDKYLFRGKRASDGAWLYGDLFHTRRRNVVECCIHSNKYCFQVDKTTVGQYTDLKDKNGKRIFEGDILTIARKTDGMGTYYVPTLASPVKVVVKWDFCGWMWETLCEDKRYLHFPDAWCHFECEIVGNIHDNPELLEVLK